MSSSQINPHEIHVALLAGGKSGEAKISLDSGNSSKRALEQAGFNVEMLNPANKNDLTRLVTGSFDVAFLCLHGKGGEDGSIQGFLETLDIPYTGSGIWASASAIDKAKAKTIYRAADLPTPYSEAVYRAEGKTNSEWAAQVGLPLVVKPACEGSSLGMYIVSDEEQITPSIKKALCVDDHVLIEQYIRGQEFTIAVLGNDNPQALPVIQIVPKASFYDFESKYAKGGSEHICPAHISDELTKTLQDLAVAAHKALGCRGVSRTDILVDEAGKCWILETNTIPGMTATSLLPDAARKVGMDFPALCTRLIELALE